MAPEMIRSTGYDQSTDIFALATLIYELLTGVPPWSDQHPLKALYSTALRGCEPFGKRFKVKLTPSILFKEFFQKCSDVRYDHRAKARDIARVLALPSHFLISFSILGSRQHVLLGKRVN